MKYFSLSGVILLTFFVYTLADSCSQYITLESCADGCWCNWCFNGGAEGVFNGTCAVTCAKKYAIMDASGACVAEKTIFVVLISMICTIVIAATIIIIVLCARKQKHEPGTPSSSSIWIPSYVGSQTKN